MAAPFVSNASGVCVCVCVCVCAMGLDMSPTVDGTLGRVERLRCEGYLPRRSARRLRRQSRH